jgi:hypothetical protein
MFNTPIEDIDFETVESFCALKLKERLDLDYKRDFPSDLAKVLCGMANVQGGMVLIGVDEDETTREPIWPPVGVDGTEDKLQQQVIQIAYDAIYPPVIPEVVVCPMVNLNRSVIVIRVDASNLLHAVDGRKKIYVRVVDHNRVHPYELADLSQLEWLWNRRSKSVEFRENLISRAQERASKLEDSEQPLLVVTLIPLYPDQLKSVSPGELLATAQKLPSSILKIGGLQLPLVPKIETGWRTIAGGVCNWSFERDLGQYLELGSQGLVYMAQQLETEDYHPESGGAIKQGVSAARVLVFYEALLHYANNYFGALQWSGPVLLKVKLQNIRNFVLDKQRRRQGSPHYEVYHHDCPDNEIELAAHECRASMLIDKHDEYLKDSATALFWAFGYGFTHDDVQEWLDESKTDPYAHP